MTTATRPDWTEISADDAPTVETRPYTVRRRPSGLFSVVAPNGYTSQDHGLFGSLPAAIRAAHEATHYDLVDDVSSLIPSAPTWTLRLILQALTA